MKPIKFRNTYLIIYILAILLGIIILCATVHAEESPIWPLLADAIYQAEGGDRGELYGIHTVSYRDAAEARGICIQLCRYHWWQWDSQGDFINYLSHRYCPEHPWRWAKNVKWFYNKFTSQLEV